MRKTNGLTEASPPLHDSPRLMAEFLQTQQFITFMERITGKKLTKEETATCICILNLLNYFKAVFFTLSAYPTQQVGF